MHSYIFNSKCCVIESFYKKNRWQNKWSSIYIFTQFLTSPTPTVFFVVVSFTAVSVTFHIRNFCRIVLNIYFFVLNSSQYWVIGSVRSVVALHLCTYNYIFNRFIYGFLKMLRSFQQDGTNVFSPFVMIRTNRKINIKIHSFQLNR